MLVFGLDFTSAPTRRKPITCACCTLHSTLLTVEQCLALSSFEQFEAFLRQDGPWIAALDFPFGQPRKLLAQLGWPERWEEYVQLVAALGKSAFEQTLIRYRSGRPAGDKLHLRATDALTGARSPMMLERIPVGKMFFAGATRLLSSPVSILPCRPTADHRIVVEGYPALAARRWLGRRSYKSDERQKQTPDQLEARGQIVAALRSDDLSAVYGLKLILPAEVPTQLIADATGDTLDALLCAIQAAWAYSQRPNNYGIPPGHELEGWIVDPASAAQRI
jgi:hypothetical protein